MLTGVMRGERRQALSRQYPATETSDQTVMAALRAHCRGFRAGVAAASDAEGRAFVTEARAVAVLRALGLPSPDAAMALDVAREDAATIVGADADTYDVRCVAALLVIELIRAKIGRVI